MKIELDETLKLSNFRRIIKLFKSSSVIKVCVDDKLYDISNIIDNDGVTIFKVNTE